MSKNYQLTTLPVMKTQMLIRKPVEKVFEAFVDPEITTKFWFTKSSGAVKPDAELVWKWDMYGVSTGVKVEEVELNRRIRITWNLNDNLSIVEWRFFPQKDGATFVTINNKGYKGSPDVVVGAALDAMGGFSFVLAAAKAWLEHGLQLNLVADHHPAGLQTDE